MEALSAVGIDVAKTWLDVVVLPNEDHLRIANDATGWETLTARLPAEACIVLEATGRYHLGVWLALEAAGLAVAVINPGRTHAFARSEPGRAKTDRHDAHLLARFAQQKQPVPTPAPSPTVRRLGALVRCREDLVQQRVQVLNRLETATETRVIATHQTVLAVLDEQVAELEQAITELIATDGELAERRRLLQTTPGVGPVISAELVAGLPELGSYDAPSIASLAGVAPHPRDSGQRTGHRSIAGGRPHIRTALYQMAFSAVRWDPAMQAHYQQLCRRCPRKVALIACARRMLGILTVMLREGLTWQDTRVGQGHYLPQEA